MLRVHDPPRAVGKAQTQSVDRRSEAGSAGRYLAFTITWPVMYGRNEDEFANH
jgi:hypothetical protein